MNIRHALSSDAESISALIKSLAVSFVANPSSGGATEFLRSITKEAIASYICSDEFLYFVSVNKDAIVGVIAIRNTTHLYHLFVARAHQRRGIATALWQHAKIAISAKAGHEPRFTVNSTLEAVLFYECLGFAPTGKMTKARGVIYIPMAREPDK